MAVISSQKFSFILQSVYEHTSFLVIGSSVVVLKSLSSRTNLQVLVLVLADLLKFLTTSLSYKS